MRLTQFGETLLPELNGVHDLSQTARTNFLPLKYGSVDLDGTETVLNHKQISATAIINTDFDDTMDDLAYEGQKGVRILKSEMRNGDERQLLAKMSVFSRNAKADNYTCEQEYGFQWNSMYPYWLATEHEANYTNHGFDTSDGLSTGDENVQSVTINSTSVSFTVNNTSRVRIPKIVFNYNFDGAAINRPRITNNTNGMYLYLDRLSLGGLGIGVYGLISIDTLSKKIFASLPDGSSSTPGEHNFYSYLYTHPDFMDWMILEPGNNSFTVTCATLGGNPTNLKIHWSNHYV